MNKKYFTVANKKPAQSYWWEVRGSDSLAKTVYEDYELIDTGVIDAAGNKIMARRKINSIGFVHFEGGDK